MRSDRPYLLHTLDSIEAIEGFVAGGRESFLGSRLIRDAVIRNFEIIGEAVGSLSPETRRKHPEVPWRKIVEFRNRLIHGYWSVDALIVWDVIVNDLPRLKIAVAEDVGESEHGDRG